MNQINISVFESFFYFSNPGLNLETKKKNDRSVVFQIIKVNLKVNV